MIGEEAVSERAKRPLDEPYEGIANELRTLVRSDTTGASDNPFGRQVEEIGKRLYSEGGHRLMQLLYYRTIQLGGPSPNDYWHGIGKWHS